MEQATAIIENPTPPHVEYPDGEISHILKLNAKFLTVMEGALNMDKLLVEENERLKKELQGCRDHIAALDGFPMQSSSRVDG